MPNKIADKWFDSIDFPSIIDTVKGIMTSDGSISVLLDYERVLDRCDLYAFKNWINGELVQGPEVGRYSVSCTFMWPHKLMPDPRAIKRLETAGCEVDWKETEIEVPVAVTNYDDLIDGTNYPKSAKRKVWLFKIAMPKSLLDDIKEGYTDLAGSSVNLKDIDDAYDEDLDKQGTETNDETDQQSQSQGMQPGMMPR